MSSATPRGYWLLVTSRHSWDLMEEAGAWSFAEKSAKKAGAIKTGDNAVVYCTGESTVTSVLEFTGPVENAKRLRLFNAMYPLEVPFKLVGKPRWSVPIQALIPRLAFVTNKKNWPSHFQGQAIRALADADFALMREALLGKSTVAVKVNHGHK